MNRNVYATILVVLAIGLYFTVTKNIIDEIAVIRESNAKYVAAIESAKNLIKTRDQILADYNSLSPDDRGRLEKIMPKGVDNIRLIIDLNNIAGQHGFSLKGIKASASGATTGSQSAADSTKSISQSVGQTAISSSALEKVTVSFEVSAPYLQFISFLQDLESSLRIMDVTHLSVLSSENGIYDWQIELQTYWLRSQ